MHETTRRLYAAAKDRAGITGQSELARALNTSPQVIKNWETRGVSRQGMISAQQRFGVHVTWIETGRGKKFIGGAPANTEAGPDIVGLVPLVSWIQAGEWHEVIDELPVGAAEEWLSCPVKHGPRTFVLRVRGESMFNPHGRPSFQDGDLIFVDPDRQAEHGSLVVVRLDDNKEATFKKLIIEGERRYLRPLNPAWPEPVIQVNGNATICGVVIFKGEEL